MSRNPSRLLPLTVIRMRWQQADPACPMRLSGAAGGWASPRFFEPGARPGRANTAAPKFTCESTGSRWRPPRTRRQKSILSGSPVGPGGGGCSPSKRAGEKPHRIEWLFLRPPQTRVSRLPFLFPEKTHFGVAPHLEIAAAYTSIPHSSRFVRRNLVFLRNCLENDFLRVHQIARGDTLEREKHHHRGKFTQGLLKNEAILKALNMSSVTAKGRRD